jgi:hypothetical protein
VPPLAHNNNTIVIITIITIITIIITIIISVALVTGSSSGVGAALVLMLADRGCDVVVNYASSAASAESVAT